MVIWPLEVMVSVLELPVSCDSLSLIGLATVGSF
jgi:hypothetical protein